MNHAIDRTNEQVCALFNARANVGEARFVCPLCRLRNVVTDKPRSSSKPAEITAEVGVGSLRLGCHHHVIMGVLVFFLAPSSLGVPRCFRFLVWIS